MPYDIKGRRSGGIVAAAPAPVAPAAPVVVVVDDFVLWSLLLALFFCKLIKQIK